MKTGSGTLILTGSNTYSGGTRINAGTLSIASDSNLGAGALTLNGGNLAVTGATTIDNAVALSANATITNSADATLSGVISGASALTKAGAGTLTLTGENSHTGGTTISGGTLQVGNGGTSGSLAGNVTNNSALSINRSDALSYGGDISGTGTLTKAGAGTLTLTGANTYDGTTRVTGGTLSVSADSNLGDDGLVLNGGNLAVTGATTIDNAIALSSNATITNSADATLSGVTSGAGVLTKAGASTLTLSGANSFSGGMTVSAGTVALGAAERLADAGSVTVNAGATFNLNNFNERIGDLAGTGSVVLGTGNLTAGTASNSTFSGTISGTGSLTKSGTGTLTLTGANSHTGGTTISAGTLQIGDGGTAGSLSGNVTNNSALIFNRSDALSYTGDISGTGSLTKSGAGTLTLTGANSHTGGTTVLGGKLVVNGSTGAITLNGGALGGAGTVGTVTANSGATIAPGNSIGTLNVAGDTGFAAGSIYAVEVDSAGNADKLAATGTVTIDSGAKVNVTAENGTDTGAAYAASTTYTIITADTAVTGTFGSVSDNFAFLDAALGYGANNVTLTLTRNAAHFASAGNTANQRAVAGGVDSLSTGNAVYDAVVGLSSAGARSAFDSLSGEIHASANGQLLEDSSLARDAIGARLRSAGAEHGEGTGVWGQSYGNWSQNRGDGNASGLERQVGGLFVGGDTDLFGGWRAGVLAGFGQTGFSAGNLASSGDADSYQLGAYASGQFGPVGVRLGSSYALHDVSTDRKVAFGGFSDQLSAGYMAGTAQVFGEIGYRVDTPLGQLEPFAGLALIHQHSNGFTETGGAAALTAAATAHMLGVTTIGVRGVHEFAASDEMTASLSGNVAWRHAIGDVTPKSTMHLAGSDAFSISGSPLARDTALLEAGLNLEFSKGATLDLSYRGALGSGEQMHGVTAGFSGRF